MRLGTLELVGPGGLSITLRLTEQVAVYAREGDPVGKETEVPFAAHHVATELMRHRLDLVLVDDRQRPFVVAELRHVGSA